VSKDPLIWCGDLAWYLTERDSDCGYRSSFGGQIAAIEGSTGSGGAGAERWLHLTSTYSLLGNRSPIARDRIMRRRWAALTSYTRDLHGAHYTGRAIVEDSTGYRRFPRGLEAGLGMFASVALHLAKLAGTERALLLAAESGRASNLSTYKEAAAAEVRTAHQAYYDLVELETPPDPDEPTDDSFSDLAESLAEETGVYSVGKVKQDGDGVWRSA
jgi:hypothetical protein